MPKLYSYTYTSLDGIMANPETWFSPYFSEELGADLTRRLEASYAMVLGGRTYKEFAEFWPNQGHEVPFADLNNNVRKFVVSNTLDQADWNNSIVINVDDLTQLKSKGDLHITGSATLVRALLESRLLDEIIIVMCPVVLGEGKGLFDGLEKTGLEMVKATPFPKGVQCLTFRATGRGKRK